MEQHPMEAKGRYKVLVVEDEGLIALDISNRLETMGYEVVAAVSSAEEAFEKAAEANIVLMDIRIDGPMDGIETAAQIRERFHLPVIFLTAHADRATLGRAKLTGPFGYIVKPLAHASLFSAIEIALHKHRLERRLEEREALLGTTLSSITDAVVVADHNSRILMWNAAAEALTGWKHAEVEGQQAMKILQLTDADSSEPAEDPMPLAILRDSAATLGRASRLVTRDGSELTIEGSVAPVKSSGRVKGSVLTFRDVTARVWEEKQIQQAQKAEATGRLAARVSHEYANHLALIRNRAEQLLTQFGEYFPGRQPVEEIAQAAAAAETLTRRLTGFGTRQVIHPEVFSLNSVLRRMSRLIESVAGGHVDFIMRLSPEIGRIKADAAQLEQAIMNLVSHSYSVMSKDSSQCGQLIVETAKADLLKQNRAPQNQARMGRKSSYLMLAITHTGHESDLEKLFEPVSIEDDGMALATVLTTVIEYGGYISARRILLEDNREGYRFEMLLPRAEEARALQSPQPKLCEAPTVLLVDYRDFVRAQLHNFFESEGYNLLEAADKTEALALGEMHEGSLDLLVAEASDADAIGAALRRRHRRLQILRIVDGSKTQFHDIRRPFTQAALLDKVSALIGAPRKLELA